MRITSHYKPRGTTVVINIFMATKLFVGGLAWKTDNESLRSHFEQFGEVTDAEVILDRDSNRSRGFGFVTLSNTDEARDAVEKTNNQDLDGRKIRVDFAGERSSRGKSFGGSGGSFRERSDRFGGERSDRFNGGDRRRRGGDYESRTPRTPSDQPRPYSHERSSSNGAGRSSSYEGHERSY
ncbi:hypothetical protein MDAP_002662 [Mitosporidium daphniae]|uniref:RRM domain-containing protein n=1 Tax=Mitosporidium daphniae TaxID=1485682 RepID=A0A098VP73_9MICR|nr:uncharacterized protein DI09_62p130 [Mitosporidium daphniae]KGG50609.1 hypothetical protein DI09_62p130 [Mitosporidium daphniae]|eukprot:XP_013237036.1 uncharacterized protein DI09_62p130 [Mitosporidium daphniae]